MSMEMTRAADYGLRAMLYLSRRMEAGSVLIGDIAAAMEIPAQFLHKVMPRLVKAGLLHSRRGARGGYRLAREPGKVSVLDIVEAIDGPILVNRCLVGSADCSRIGSCAIEEVCRQAQKAITAKLDDFSLADLNDLEADLERESPASSTISAD
jgi:Rrf2 family protein